METTKLSKETITKEANEYYKDKNIHLRYIVLFVILLVFSLWFLMPVINMNTDEPSEKNIDISISDFKFTNQNVFDKDKITSIQKDLLISELYSIDQNTINLVFNRDDFLWTQIEKDLQKYWVNKDLYFLAISLSKLENLDNTMNKWIRKMTKDTATKYWLIVNESVDQRLNTPLQTRAISMQLETLYNKYKNRNLVIISKDIWEENLDTIIENQGTNNFNDIYFTPNELDLLYNVYAWKYVFENKWTLYTQENNIDLAHSFDTNTMNVKQIVNITDRTAEKDIDYPIFKQLNPRILGNYLPKWDRTVLIPVEK